MPKKYTRKNKRLTVKRGGQDKDEEEQSEEFVDLEKGKEEVHPPMGDLPPDKYRFKMYQDNLIKELQKLVSDEEAAAVYAGPNPTERMKREQKMMGDEDPLNLDPFVREELNMFSRGGRRTKKRRQNKRKASRHRRR